MPLYCKAKRQIFTPVLPVDQALITAQRVLVVEAPAVMELLSPKPGAQSVIVTHKRMLNAAMLDSIRPDAIVGPLISPDWDIVDLAITVSALAYSGNFFVLTQPLPRAELVIREVRAVCPNLTVKLIEVA
ncbi:hypothetical protein [Pararhodobacter oceanensis]|uniref:hypothetical protein n=1 Tax=Pararhodobacter oceanensis TaxID=2172121 RepID=UPI003A92F7C0